MCQLVGVSTIPVASKKAGDHTLQTRLFAGDLVQGVAAQPTAQAFSPMLPAATSSYRGRKAGPAGNLSSPNSCTQALQQSFVKLSGVMVKSGGTKRGATGEARPFQRSKRENQCTMKVVGLSCQALLVPSGLAFVSPAACKMANARQPAARSRNTLASF